jgi:hypothetical protein
VFPWGWAVYFPDFLSQGASFPCRRLSQHKFEHPRKVRMHASNHSDIHSDQSASRFQQPFGDMHADKAGGAGKQNFH